MSLAWKEVKKNKGKYAIIILVLVATMYLVFFTIGLTTGLRNLGASKITNAPGETYILSEGSNKSLAQSAFSGAYATDIHEDLGDEDAFILGAKLANVENIHAEHNTDSFEIAYFGMEADSFMTPQILEGDIPQKENEVIASSYIQSEGVELGDTIRDISMNVSYTIVGFANDETYSYSPILYLSPEQFTQTTLTGQMVGFATVQAIVSEQDPETILNRLDGDYEIDVVNKDEIITNIPGLLAQSVSFLLLIICMYIISGAILGMFFYIITLQKQKEFGQLKAFGASTNFLLRMIISQVTIVVAISVTIGIALIYLTNILLPSVVPFLFHWGLILSGSFIFIIVALLGALVSLFKVTRVDPIIAIGGNN